MIITINISGTEGELKVKVQQAIDRKINEHMALLKEVDITALIKNRIDYLVDKSKYVSDSIIRNLVQQKIAKEIADKIMKGE